MQIVGINTSDEKIFRASSFNTEDEKERSKQGIQVEADNENYPLRFEEMDIDQLRAFNAQ